MKNFILLCLFTLVFTPVALLTQTDADSTGFAGDNFSLEGALELLKKSPTLEAFEEKLNAEDSYVNNLDLNEDGQIDYVKVIDSQDADLHAIVLQVDVSERESQDIAVILLERTGDENALLQIVGDEDVYGEEKIIEPYAEEVDAGGKGGPHMNFNAVRIVVNVWAWPSVRYIYAPGYRVYVSPWRWNYYPSWFKPWRPHPWRWHYQKRSIYHVHYKPFPTHRVVRANNFYKPHRKTSVTVKTRTVHTRTVVKKGSGGKSVSVQKKTVKSSKIQKRGKDHKIETKTTRSSKKGVKTEKGAKIKSKKTTRKSTRSK